MNRSNMYDDSVAQRMNPTVFCHREIRSQLTQSDIGDSIFVYDSE